jgi:hypothetical protein
MTPPLTLPQMVRNLQIIIFALGMGCLVFLGVVLLVLERPKEANLQSTMIGIAMAVTTGVVRVFLPGVFVAQARQRAAREVSEEAARATLVQAFLTSSILAAALHEGAVFTNLLMYTQSSSYANLAVAAVMFLGIPLLFPTVGGVEEWIESQRRIGSE